MITEIGALVDGVGDLVPASSNCLDIELAPLAPGLRS